MKAITILWQSPCCSFMDSLGCLYNSSSERFWSEYFRIKTYNLQYIYIYRYARICISTKLYLFDANYLLTQVAKNVSTYYICICFTVGFSRTGFKCHYTTKFIMFTKKTQYGKMAEFGWIWQLWSNRKHELSLFR